MLGIDARPTMASLYKTHGQMVTSASSCLWSRRALLQQLDLNSSKKTDTGRSNSAASVSGQHAVDHSEATDAEPKAWMAKYTQKVKPVSFSGEPATHPSDLKTHVQYSEPIISMSKENHKMKSAKTCKSCFSAEIGVLFLPCRHLVVCQECERLLNNCPQDGCKRHILATVKIYWT